MGNFVSGLYINSLSIVLSLKIPNNLFTLISVSPRTYELLTAPNSNSYEYMDGCSYIMDALQPKFVGTFVTTSICLYTLGKFEFNKLRICI